MLIFKYQKYKEFRMRKDNLTEEDLRRIDEFDHLSMYDGMTHDDVWRAGKIILKDWCVETE